MATSNHRHPADIILTIGTRSIQIVLNGDSRPFVPAPRRRGLASIVDRRLQRAAPSPARPAAAAEGGALIARHAPFEVFAELSKVVRAARNEILIVDPYVNATALTDIAVCAREGVRIRILGDRAGVKSSLGPAVSRWQAQYRAARPLEVRLSATKSLHDRLLLIDRTEVWNLSQSIADFASRSPASIERSGSVIAREKADIYLGLWTTAAPMG